MTSCTCMEVSPEQAQLKPDHVPKELKVNKGWIFITWLVFWVSTITPSGAEAIGMSSPLEHCLYTPVDIYQPGEATLNNSYISILWTSNSLSLYLSMSLCLLSFHNYAFRSRSHRDVFTIGTLLVHRRRHLPAQVKPHWIIHIFLYCEPQIPWSSFTLPRQELPRYSLKFWLRRCCANSGRGYGVLDQNWICQPWSNKSFTSFRALGLRETPVNSCWSETGVCYGPATLESSVPHEAMKIL